jgi:hypothetical protein
VPDARARQPLPRVEDLRAAEQGFDREQVREAFDSFYRHIAQLDSTMRALEAVEVFRDQAGALRKELRALKAAGWTQQPWPSYGRERVSPGLPESLPRFALEAVFLIVVAVVVAVAGFDRLSIVLVMGLAWAIVGVVEWAASRERFARARVPTPVRGTIEPAPPAPLRIVPADAAPADAWEAPAPPAAAEADEVEDERTVIRPGREEPEEPEVAAVSEPAVESDPEPVAEADPEPSPALEPAELEARAAKDEEDAVRFQPAAEVPLSQAEVEREAQEELEPEPASELAPEPELEPVSGLVREPEPEPISELAREPEPEPLPPPELEEAPAARWSWAADTTVERARERELAQNPPAPRRRFWQRRRRDSDGFRLESPQPRHVRVLPPGPSFDEQFPVDDVDPWEQELDLSIEEPEGTVGADRDRERETALDRGDRA